MKTYTSVYSLVIFCCKPCSRRDISRHGKEKNNRFQPLYPKLNKKIQLNIHVMIVQAFVLYIFWLTPQGTNLVALEYS